MLTVACVLHVPQFGAGDYGPDYVARLHRGIDRHLSRPYRFVCLSNTDVPCERIPLKYGWGHWWAKMELFRPDLDGERVLYFDLDTLIVGDISRIAGATSPTMLSDFNVPEWAASGVMMLPAEARAQVWAGWISAPELHMKRQAGHGDGGFLRAFPAARWQDLLPGQIVSYKNHVQGNGEIPDGARVVCFHGHPRPAELPADHWIIKRHWQ